MMGYVAGLDTPHHPRGNVSDYGSGVVFGLLLPNGHLRFVPPVPSIDLLLTAHAKACGTQPSSERGRRLPGCKDKASGGVEWSGGGAE